MDFFLHLTSSNSHRYVSTQLCSKLFRTAKLTFTPKHRDEAPLMDVKETGSPSFSSGWFPVDVWPHTLK